ncbi:MAG: hypothetical protein HDR72_02885 [Ruminococcaceae bacterium]|nr:hypothetical protein [Oscillospiraceae bacterium]
MKKITSIILTAILLTSLTACSAKESSNPADDGEKLINVIAPSQSDEKSPENSDDVTEKETPEKVDEQSPEESKTEDNSEDEKAPDTAPGDKTDNTDENKTDNEQTKAPEETKPASALPLKDYPDGSYFTYDGKPCEDHSNCDWAGDDCNCIKFDRAIQAVGFAKYVYFEVTGKHISLDNKTNIDLDITADSAKSCLMGAPVGTYVAAETNNELFHTMIVADSDKDGITLYQANYGGKCRVSLMTLTWAEFAERFPHLDYYIK